MTNFKEYQDAPMHALAGTKLNLALSRRIRDGSGLVGASVTGRQQSGKSVYGLLVMYELHQGDIDALLEHTVFSISELTNLISTALETQTRLPAILWDDSSVHGSAMKYNSERKAVELLSALGDTLGIACKGLLLTSPSGDIIKSFRNYNFFSVQIAQGRGKYDRVARGYERGKSPAGQSWIRSSFIDLYDVRVPFYQKYFEKRQALSISVVQNMKELLDKKQHRSAGLNEDMDDDFLNAGLKMVKKARRVI